MLNSTVNFMLKALGYLFIGIGLGIIFLGLKHIVLFICYVLAASTVFKLADILTEVQDD